MGTKKPAPPPSREAAEGDVALGEPRRNMLFRHPWASWSTAASIATVVVAWPIVSPWIPRPMTVDAAQKMRAEIKAEHDARFAKLEADADARAASIRASVVKAEADAEARAAAIRAEVAKAATRHAWQAVRVSNVETLILRNQLNECGPDSRNRPPARICAQYKQEYDESYTRSLRLQQEAQSAVK